MHFIPEACYRRPLEPRSLVYLRGGTAIIMGIAFLGFCGYLGISMYYDQYLIVLSTESTSRSLKPPDVEFCLWNSTMIIPLCMIYYTNGTSEFLHDCYSKFFRPVLSQPDFICYLFEANGSFAMRDSSEVNTVLHFRFYWKIDGDINATSNETSTSLVYPFVRVQLYDTNINPWKSDAFGDTPAEDQIYTNILYSLKPTFATMNHSTVISFAPQRYRAIKPRSTRALLGFEPDYVDVNTYSFTKEEIRLSDRSYNRNKFDGTISMRFSTSNISVKTEVRQHTLLASISLAGGCYGVLNTLYIILFGMTRMTPWGLVHHIPVFISHRRSYRKNDHVFEEALIPNSNKEQKNYGEDEIGSINDINDGSEIKPREKKRFTIKSIPWFFRTSLNVKSIKAESDTNILKRIMMINNIKKNNGDHDSMTKLGCRTSFSIYNDSILQNSDGSSTKCEISLNIPESSIEKEVNKLSKTNDFLLNVSSSTMKNQQQRGFTSVPIRNRDFPQVFTSSHSMFFSEFNNNSINNNNVDEDNIKDELISPKITTRPSMSSDEAKSNPLYQQEMYQNSVQVLTEEMKQEKKKVKKLTADVEELKMILSQYFIDTAYFDQLYRKDGKACIDGANVEVKKRIRRSSDEES